MSGAGLAFFALAFAALAAALVAAIASSRRRAAIALAVTAGAEVAITCSLGAWTIATAEVAFLCAGMALLARTRDAAGAESLEPRREPALADVRRGLPVLLVVAFVALAARAVLMVRWPNVAAGTPPATTLGIVPVGFAHHLLVQLLVFGAGWLTAVTRRGFDGIAIGVATMLVAVVSLVAAAGTFTGSTSQANVLAAVALGTATAAAWLCQASDRRERPRLEAGEDGARAVSTGLVAALAGCALALLVGAW